MSNVVLKEGWIALHLVYTHGGESWNFYPTKPDYVDSAMDMRTEGDIPNRLTRIFYCEADSAELKE